MPAALPFSLAPEPVPANERTPLMSTAVAINSAAHASTAPLSEVEAEKAQAFLDYLDKMLQTDEAQGTSKTEIASIFIIAVLGFVSGMPNWQPAFDYGNEHGGRAWGGFLLICGAVSYCSFNSLSFSSLVDAIRARRDKVNTAEGSGKGIFSSFIYGAALLIGSLLISSASAFQAFKLNSGATAYVFTVIDLMTNMITNALSLQKLHKLLSLRIFLTVLLGIILHPTTFLNIISNAKKSSDEIYNFLRKCELSEDDISSLKRDEVGNITVQTLMQSIFITGKERNDRLDARYFGLNPYLEFIPVLAALVISSFSGYYYWLASCEVMTAVLTFFGIYSYAAVISMASVLALIPAYLEFTLVAGNLLGVFNNLPEIISDTKSLFVDFYTKGVRNSFTDIFNKDPSTWKESDLLLKHSKTLWGIAKILLITTFFAWGQRAQAITKMDELDPTTQQLVKIFNIINSVCYKSGAMWKLTDTLGLAMVKRYGEAALKLVARCVVALRKFTDVVSDMNIKDAQLFIATWENDLAAFDAELTKFLRADSISLTLAPPPAEHPSPG